MKKRIILLLIIFFLSGCSVEYNIEFNDNNLTESINIGKFDASKIEDFEYLTPYAIVNEANQEFYKINYSNNILNLSYRYNTSNFQMSEAFNECYELSSFSYDEENYYILTSEEFKCLSYMGYTSDEVKINFKSNHKIISSNADYIEDNIHTWVSNNTNSKNKPINITISSDSDNSKNNKIVIPSVFILFIIASIVVGVTIFLINSRGKRKNKI